MRGHARGLTGLDGARARFAMRYVLREGEGLNVAHGVVVAGAEVRGGAFEACVCMPRGGSGYPQMAAVVFAPGTTGETGREVARAMFSQRYATLGDEDVSFALNEVPSAPETEAALAALVDRTHELRVRGLDGMAEGGRAYAALVADERPVAAQVIGGVVEGALSRSTGSCRVGSGPPSASRWSSTATATAAATTATSARRCASTGRGSSTAWGSGCRAPR